MQIAPKFLHLLTMTNVIRMMNLRRTKCVGYMTGIMEMGFIFCASRKKAILSGRRKQENSVLVLSKPSVSRCLHANESSEAYILAHQTL
jgi:hypothetical protein